MGNEDTRIIDPKKVIRKLMLITPYLLKKFVKIYKDLIFMFLVRGNLLFIPFSINISWINIIEI